MGDMNLISEFSGLLLCIIGDQLLHIWLYSPKQHERNITINTDVHVRKNSQTTTKQNHVVQFKT